MHNNFLLSLLILLMIGCDLKNQQPMYVIDVQGHRGCRGLLPENTIPAFEHALSLGVTTLELDIVVSKDHQIIVSHEPFFSHEISTSPEGLDIPKEEEKSHNIYGFLYREIKKYDVGRKHHARFPDQKKMSAFKPSLSDMVKAVEAKTAELNRSKVKYNIELKRQPELDSIYLPNVRSFVDLTLKTIKDLGIEDRTSLQCFDIECLQIIHEEDPSITLVYLIQNTDSITENLEKLGFMPDAYSPYYKLVTPVLSEICKEKGIKLVPWTVNEIVDMEKMMEMNVDGIITDYPDRLIELIEAKSNVEIQ